MLARWYDGEEAGTAIAETLAGVNNPAGRLPVTFYKGVDQLPPFEDYSMKGRTYRYFTGEPLWGFGFGLSYSTFTYSAPKVQGSSASTLVKNTSSREGDEVVQMYVGGALAGFQRVHLKAGESRSVKFEVAGKGRVFIGGSYNRAAVR